VETLSKGFFLNRFSVDVFQLETEYSKALTEAYIVGLYLIMCVVLAVVGTPWALFVCLALAVFVEIARRLYGPLSIQLRSLEAASKSPLYAISAELGDPAAMELFRAFKSEPSLRRDSTKAIDKSNRPVLLLRLARCWLVIIGVRFPVSATVCLVDLTLFRASTQLSQSSLSCWWQ
jgi:ATP-binding cassette subfamily C (CFTR/MRP) protein 1